MYRGTCEHSDACFDFQCDVVSVVADEDGAFDKPSEVVCLGHGEVSGDCTGNLAETSAGNFSAQLHLDGQPVLVQPALFAVVDEVAGAGAVRVRVSSNLVDI